MSALCAACADPHENVVSSLVVGQVFHPQKARKVQTKTVAQQKSANNARATQAADTVDTVTKGYPGGTFVVECKFDGWRVAVHVGDIHDKGTLQCAAPLTHPLSM